MGVLVEDIRKSWLGKGGGWAWNATKNRVMAGLPTETNLATFRTGSKDRQKSACLLLLQDKPKLWNSLLRDVTDASCSVSTALKGTKTTE